MGNGLVNPENRVCQRANSCETDFAVRIKSAQAPGCAARGLPGKRVGTDITRRRRITVVRAGARP